MGEATQGALLCTIIGAGRHIWTWHGGDLYVYENAIAAIPTTLREVRGGIRDARKRWPFDASGIYSEDGAFLGDLDLEKLLGRPGSQLFPAAEIIEASLRKGLVTANLSITPSNGPVKRWVWLPRGPMNVPYADVQRAVRRMLGSKLQTE